MPDPRGRETSRQEPLGRKDRDKHGPKGKDSIQDLPKKMNEEKGKDRAEN